ncbi:hypothetical protein ACJ73_08267 [Blastomyces percursus]|uniref:CCHC-type domain-containing protein n=1 Tax=Blastomyces percursus TaxID=1658174 RepID=A0A1J9PVR9_9EURO|nr:hypothetical protein ACJ73_08267 [Blastomyces percursus]
MEDTHGLVSVNEAPAWLRTMLELQQQRVAEMRACQQAALELQQQQVAKMRASQQRQDEEIQQRLMNRATPSSRTSSSAEPVIPPMSMDSLKEQVDGAAIGSLTNQAWYVGGRLTGRAKQKFHPWMEACDPSLRTPENVFKHLDVLFKDTAAQRKALDWLQNARQENIPLTTFLPDFDTKILEADGQLWEDRMKISMLKKALLFELLKALVSVEEVDVYEAFCVQMRRIDYRLTKLKSVRSTSGRRSSPATSPPLVRRDPDIMDWEESNTYAQATRASAVRSSYRVPGLTLKEVTDRRRRGVCINCERSGHIAADCKFDFVPSGDKRRVRANHATVDESPTRETEDFREGSGAGKRLAPAKNRRQELEEVGRQQFEDKMMMDAILVPSMIDNMHNINAMVDSVVRRLNLQRTPLPKPRPLAGFDGPRGTSTHFMVRFGLDVGGHPRENVYAYEVDDLDYDLMLGISWLAEQGILLDARNRTLIFPNGDRIHEDDVHNTMELKQILANAYELLRKSSRRNRTKSDCVVIYTASLADIKKALEKLTVTVRTDPRDKLPRQYHEYLDVFRKDNTIKSLPPLRGPGIDHKIELRKEGR